MRYDLIVIDAPGGRGPLIRAALTCADDVLLPLDAGAFGRMTVEQTRDLLHSCRACEEGSVRLYCVLIGSSAEGALVMMDSGTWVSTDSGVTWTEDASVVGGYQVACSSDGTRMAAATSQGLWVSSDTGATWTQDNVPGAGGGVSGITMSADGSKLAACVSGGNIWTSTDSGSSWNEDTSVGATQPWYSITSSADGTVLAAVGLSSSIWTSTDSGASWTEDATVGAAKVWYSVRMSGDGSVIVALEAEGNA